MPWPWTWAKTIIGLRDTARLLPDCAPARYGATPFPVAAPTQAILYSWRQESRKFELAHLLDAITTTYRSLGKALGPGRYQKFYLNECHAPQGLPRAEPQSPPWRTNKAFWA